MQCFEKILNFVLRTDTGRHELDHTSDVRTNGRKGKVKVSHGGGKGHDRGKAWRGWGRRVKYWIKVKTRTKGGARAESTVEGRATIGKV